MKKASRSILMAASLATVLIAITVPAALSLNGLGKVQDTIAAIQQRHERVATTRVLLDQFADIQSDFLGLLLNIDPVKRRELNAQAREMTRFNSALDRVMTVSAEFVTPQDQVELWNAASAVSQGWLEVTNMNLATLNEDDRVYYFRQITSNIRRVQAIVGEINTALARDNNSYVTAAIARVDLSAMLMVVIMIGGLVIGISATAFVLLLVRDMRRAERDVRESEAKVAAQNDVFKAALNNMRHGLSMYGADYRLDVINQRFLEIYGFADDEIWPGMSVEELRKLRSERGYRIYSQTGEKIVDVFKTARSANGEVPQAQVELERDIIINGRIIRVTRTPREGGGWVVMHADITERRRALMALEVRERELTEQNQRFKDLVEGSPYGMSMFDGDHRLVVCNSGYIEIYGLAGIDPRPGTAFEDITDDIFDRKVYSDSSDEMRAKFKAGAQVPQTASRVYEFSDGRFIRMSRFPRASGGWVAIHEDVTARRKTERELEANKAQLAVQNELFSDALENMGQGLTMYDHDNRLLVHNQQFMDYYGLSAGDIEIGMPLRDVAVRLLETFDDDVERPDVNLYVVPYYAPVEERTSFIRLRPLRDGRIVEVSSHLRPEGGWVVVHRDVTEREQARRELELSESAQRQQSELFKDALDNMGYGLNVFDAKGRILVYNQQYLDMAGLAAEELHQGITAREIIDLRKEKGRFSESSEEFVDQHYAALRNNEYFEHLQTSVDGQVIASAFYPRKVGGWVVLHRDITEILQAENEIRQAAEESEQLRRQEQSAVAANQAKSAFLAMMSHEIRTPMNAVIGLSSALLGSDLSADQHHIVETIHESSNSLLRLLNDILDISKLDAGKVEFEAAPFSFASMLDQVVSIVEAKAIDKGLSVRASADEAMPAVLVGDQTRIRQVVLNLMTNAIKFTESGFVEVRARCTSRDATHATIECVVADTGIGISEGHLGKLFSEFSQADSSINRRFGGTGLGLAISKRIIEQMGGDIRVESVLAVGTTFTVTLSLPVADVSALADRHGRKTTNEFMALLGQAERPLQVMLAEDNPTNQLVFTKLMQDCNVQISMAEDGRRALELAQHQTFDVVFMDMRMPEMDGLQATRAIRELGGLWQKIPIIALTANAFADDVRACREAGMDEFLSKPIRKATLLEMLARVLQDHPLLVNAFAAVSMVQQAAALDALPMTPPAEVMMTDVAPILDRRAFDILVEEIDADGVRMTLDVFLSETEQRLALLHRLSPESDRKRIRDEAHTLKGSSGTFALRQVQELSKTLEHAAPEITQEAYVDLVARIEASFAVGRVEVEAALAAAEAASAG